MKEANSEGVNAHAEAFSVSCRSKAFTVKGPNREISIDGHDKLLRVRLEIYGAIDAYSRFIVWCYVGISNRTEVSVKKQYLSLIRSTICVSKMIRSDKGTILISKNNTLRPMRPVRLTHLTPER